jgi:hypothetical protein
MVMPEDNPPPRRATNFQRMNSTTGWAVAGAVILIVLALIFLVQRGTHHKPGENPPATATQSQPQK